MNVLPTAPSAEQASAIRDFFLPAIESGHRINRILLQHLPPESLSFQPEPGTLPLSEVVWSLIATEHFFLAGICDGVFSQTPSRPEDSGIDALLAWDDEHFPNDLGRLASLSGEELTRSIEFLGSSLQVIELLHFYMGNMAQHRGQIAMYLQLQGIPQQFLVSTVAGTGEPGELSEAELAAVAGGQTTNLGVQVSFYQTNQTAQQLGWLPMPQNMGNLGSLFSSSGAGMAGGLAGLPAGIAAAIAIPMYISTFFML